LIKEEHYFITLAQQPPVGQGLVIVEDFLSYHTR